MMNLLYPAFKMCWLPRMLGIAVLGALIAGLYGIVHDQITYTISPEYYTKLKFMQFSYADFGLSPRFFVAEIGFLATWWVGFFSGWFLARVAVPAWPAKVAVRRSLQAFLIILCVAFLSASVGYLMASFRPHMHVDWVFYCESIGVQHMRDFVKVAYIHNGSYLGGLIGLFLAIPFLYRLRKSGSTAAKP